MTEKEAKAQLDKLVEKFKTIQRGVLDSYVELGAELYNLKNSNLYMYIRTKDGALGYGSVYDLIQEYFAMSKTSVKNYIGVYERFVVHDSNSIKPKFKEYSFAQLCEMLSLNDSQILACKPSMTCEAIRELKKKDKGKVKEDEFVPDPNNSLKLDMSKELYAKVLSRANRRQKNMADLVIEILELYFSTLKDE